MEQIHTNIQQRLSTVRVPFIKQLHEFKNVPEGFKPWQSGLSPSALYNCSLQCRKKMKIKTPEYKWISIKRWVTVTPSGYELPAGIFYSIKRKEQFVPTPKPHLEKKEYVLIMLPYGNVWSMHSKIIPITEEWLFTMSAGKFNLEHLIMKDAAHPLNDYFYSCYKFAQDNPDQIGIHLKRKRHDKELD